MSSQFPPLGTAAASRVGATGDDLWAHRGNHAVDAVDGTVFQNDGARRGGMDQPVSRGTGDRAAEPRSTTRCGRSGRIFRRVR